MLLAIPFGITIDLVCDFAKRNFNTEQTRQHRATMTLHCISLYTTELLHSLSHIEYELLFKQSRGLQALERCVITEQVSKSPAIARARKNMFSVTELCSQMNDLNIGETVLYTEHLKEIALLLSPHRVCDVCITITLAPLEYTLKIT